MDGADEAVRPDDNRRRQEERAIGRADRAAARALAPRRFLEIHCAAPLSVCEARDPKGLYKKARAGVLRQFTGLTSPYEPPRRPDLTLATGTEPLERSVDRLLRLLKRRRFF